jgi:uncharacterized membrane protein HdeD (DUF308 family)
MNLLIIWGLILTILGIVALVFPYFFAVGSVIFFGALMTAAGLIWSFYHINARHKGAGGWLKPFVLILIGAILLLFPEQSIVILSVFLLIYLLTDAFANFYFALEFKDRLASWFLMLLNCLLDLVLAGILVYFIPHPKMLAQIFGILIGVSLLIDGIFALWFGWRLKVYYDKYHRLIEEQSG